MITAAEARKKANDENAKLRPIVLTLIDKAIKKACRQGEYYVSVQISNMILDERHVRDAISVLNHEGYGCRAKQLTCLDEPADWLFEISW